MTPLKIYITRRIADEALAMLRQAAELRVWEGDAPPPRDVLLREVADVDGLLCLLTDTINREVMDAAPRLRAVSTMAVGYNHIDVAAATEREIPVGYTPGVLTETTADFAWALLMAAARRVVEGDAYTRAGKWGSWGPSVLLGYDVYGATLGIVGLGRIGLAVARRAKGFQMRVLYHSRERKRDVERQEGIEWLPDLPALLRQADFVSLHVPLTPETRHLIGRRELAAMKRTAVLVNTARGGVVDQRALYEALRDRTIAAAATDVAEVEPIPPDDPLLTLGNVIITPHIASASVATRTRMAVLAARNLLAGLRGEPMPSCVNSQAASTGGP